MTHIHIADTESERDQFLRAARSPDTGSQDIGYIFTGHVGVAIDAEMDVAVAPAAGKVLVDDGCLDEHVEPLWEKAMAAIADKAMKNVWGLGETDSPRIEPSSTIPY